MKKYTFIILLFPLIFTWNCPANDGTTSTIKKVEYQTTGLGEGDYDLNNEYNVFFSSKPIQEYESQTISISGLDISQYLGNAGPGLYVTWLLNDIKNTGISCGEPSISFIVIIRQNGSTLLSSEYSVTHVTASNWGYAEFPLKLIDQTYATPETHTYTLEFWECKNYCDFKEYRKKTKKKEEITITVNFTP